MKLTVIGSGNMGGALVKGWAAKAAAAGIDITATARSRETTERMLAACPGIHVTTDNLAAARDADIIVVAVKPWLVKTVIDEIRSAADLNNQLLVSVAANVGTAQLRQMLGSEQARVFYAMPNIAAEFGESMTFVAPAEGVEAADVERVRALFSLVGRAQVCEERLIGPGMMMAGCGIAYVMRFLRAMQEGGVEMGFYPNDAQQIAMQTMQGAVTLLRETHLHPEAAIDRVTTPGGVTIKGLNELDHAAFNSAVIRCLKAGMK